jgi:hypothetical protein
MYKHKTPIRRQKLINILESTAEYYGCTLQVETINADVDGFYQDGVIHLSDKLNNILLISAFFHELAHCLCCKNNIYQAYHNDTLLTQDVNITSKEFLDYAYEAELYVDWLGKILMKRVFKGIQYYNSYDNTKNCREEFGELFIKLNN